MLLITDDSLLDDCQCDRLPECSSWVEEVFSVKLYWARSNKRVNRSARSGVLMVSLSMARAPGYAYR